jgi:hypothetical protein
MESFNDCHEDDDVNSLSALNRSNLHYEGKT